MANLIVIDQLYINFSALYVCCRYKWIMVLCLENGFKMLGLGMKILNSMWNTTCVKTRLLQRIQLIHSETQPRSEGKKLHVPVLAREVVEMLKPDTDQV